MSFLLNVFATQQILNKYLINRGDTMNHQIIKYIKAVKWKVNEIQKNHNLWSNEF